MLIQDLLHETPEDLSREESLKSTTHTHAGASFAR